MDYVNDLFRKLESNNPHTIEEVKSKFHEYLNGTKESWLMNGLLDYYLATGSIRIVEVLVGIREPQERLLFDKLSDTLRGANKLQALTLLGHIVRRHPTWLYKITNHSLLKDLLKLLKAETDMIPVMSALLVVIVLLPMIAGLVAPYLQEIFEVFSRLASWNTNNQNKMPEGHLLHLQIGLYALFHRLYGMFPCNFLTYLRHEYGQRDNLTIFKHTIRPMLDTIKMHPLLVVSAKDTETTSLRWKNMEPHDIIVECAKFAVDPSDRPKDEIPKDRSSQTGENRSALETSGVLDGSYTSRGVRAYSSHLQSTCDKDLWTPKTVCGAMSPPEPSAPTSIPHTPISQTFSVGCSMPQPEGTSPPEAAVEATPETTPIKDIRQIGRGPPPIGSNVARALNSSLGPGGGSPMPSQPSSPMKKEASPWPYRYPDAGSAFQQPVRGAAADQQRRDSMLASQKMQRLLLERNQASETQDTKSAKHKPLSPLRVIPPSVPNWTSGYDIAAPTSPLALHDDTHTQEDREVERTLGGDDASGTGRQTCDSVLQDFQGQHGHGDEHDDYDDCLQESGSPCTSGGLHMPNSQSMRDFARQVNRLRYYSQSSGSEPDSGGLQVPGYQGESKVRRALSCPEMKKSVSISQPAVDRPLDESEEDRGPTVNGHTTLAQEVVSAPSSCKRTRKRMVSGGTQTESPLPYEHLFLGVFPALDQHHTPPPGADNSAPSLFPSRSSSRYSPHEAIDAYIARTTDMHTDRRGALAVEAELKQCKEQLVLMNLQLEFERHRREVHAERNRRLLGKSRVNRSLEEHNSALQDQVVLLQNDVDRISTELEQFRREAGRQIESLRDSDGYWRGQARDVQRAYEETRVHCDTVQQELRQEREKTATVTKTLNETKATLIDTNNELQTALSLLSSSREAQNELQTVQRELLIQGEMHQKVHDTLANFARATNRASELSLYCDTYNHHIEVLSTELELQKSDFTALTKRLSELEALVAEKESLLGEQKCLLANAQAEHNEQYTNLDSKYSELTWTHTKVNEQIVSLNAQIESLTIQVRQLKIQQQQQQQQQRDEAEQKQQQPLPSSSGSGSRVNPRGVSRSLASSSHQASGQPSYRRLFPMNTPEIPMRNLHHVVEDDIEAADATSDNTQ